MKTIGNKAIEVHLRMGDIDLVDYGIIKLSVLNQIEKNDEEIIRQMKIINLKKKQKISIQYLFGKNQILKVHLQNRKIFM